MAVLNLDARFELCKIEKVAAVNRHPVNLVRGEYALYGSLLSIYSYCGTLYFNHCALLAKFQLHIAGCGNGNLHDHR